MLCKGLHSGRREEQRVNDVRHSRSDFVESERTFAASVRHEDRGEGGIKGHGVGAQDPKFVALAWNFSREIFEEENYERRHRVASQRGSRPTQPIRRLRKKGLLSDVRPSDAVEKGQSR